MCVCCVCACQEKARESKRKQGKLKAHLQFLKSVALLRSLVNRLLQRCDGVPLPLALSLQLLLPSLALLSHSATKSIHVCLWLCECVCVCVCASKLVCSSCKEAKEAPQFKGSAAGALMPIPSALRAAWRIPHPGLLAASDIRQAACQSAAVRPFSLPAVMPVFAPEAMVRETTRERGVCACCACCACVCVLCNREGKQ